VDTAKAGQAKAFGKIKELGATDILITKESNKTFITFKAPNGKRYKFTTRSKKSKTWQTSITYGKECPGNQNESEFWVFVDIANEQGAFYIVPLFWVKNDIYIFHKEYLKKHGGHRPFNENSIHHSIAVKRIEKWKDEWRLMGF
jgi:hypothetical protein